jgi:hypothetical protein
LGNVGFKDTASALVDQAKAGPEHTAKQLQDARDRYTFITPANRNAPPD